MRRLLLYLFTLLAMISEIEGNKSRGLYKGEAGGEENLDRMNSYVRTLIEDSPTEALQHATALLEQSRLLGYRKGEADACFNLGAYYYRMNKYDSSMVYYKYALNHYAENESGELIAQTFYQIGKIFDSVADFDSAKIYYHEALSIANKNGVKDISGLSLIAIGNIERIEGFHETSFEKHLQAYDILRNTSNPGSIAEALRQIGTHYRNAGEYSEALHYYRRALIKYKGISNWRGEATALGYIGLIHLDMNKPDSALHYHEIALSIREKNRDMDGTAISLLNIANVFDSQKNYNEALPYILQSLKIREKTGNLYGVVLAHQLLAKTEIALNEFEKAENSLRIADSIASENHFMQLSMDIKRIYSEFYEETGDYKSAYYFYKQFSKISDSLKAVENSRKMSSLKSGYENDKKMEELELLQQKEKLESSIVLVFAVLMVLAFVFALYVVRKNKLYNNALVTIREQNLQLEELNVTLSEKNQSLTELNFTKDKFLSIVAHDLRNPFVTILGYTAMLTGKDYVEPEEQTYMIRQIDKSAQRAHILLENLLQWGMSQTGNISMQIEKQSLKYITLESIAQVKAQAEKKNITISLLDEEESFVMADITMILTVMRNLLTNAVKFTPQGGAVKIWTEITSDNAKIHISDSGIGIPEDEICTLFEVGKGKEGTEREKGSGLGLILCKEFIERNKGELFVESLPGKGSTFSFTLPLAK